MILGLLSLFCRPGPKKRTRVDKFISIGSHVKILNSAWSGYPGHVVDMHYDDVGVLLYEVYLDPAGPDQPGGPIVPVDISQLLIW